MTTFDTSEAFCAYVREHVASDANSELSDSLANEVTPVFMVLESPPQAPGSLGMILPAQRWVIRDDDLKLLEAVFSAAVTAAAAGLLGHELPAGQPSAPAVAGLAAAVIRLLRQAYAKGARLSRKDMLVLLALKRSGGGLTERELLASLGAAMPKQDQWTEAKVVAALARLERVPLRDGTTVAVVSKDGQGLWRAAGV